MAIELKNLTFDQEDIDESIDQINHFLNSFYQLKEGKVEYNDMFYNETFRVLHNLKGTFSMLGLLKLSNFVHRSEARLLSIKNDKHIMPGMISYFIKIGENILNALEDGSFDIHQEALAECWNCLEKSFKEACNNKPISQTNTNHPTKKIVIISKKDERDIINKIDNKFEYKLYDCPNKVYHQKEDILNADLVLICDELNESNPFSFIKVINLVNKNCLVYLLRGKREIDLPEHYKNRIFFLSVGRDTTNYVERIFHFINTNSI